MRLASTEPETQAKPDHAADDLRLVELARTNPRAFGPLYDRYAASIYLYCHRQLHRHVDAEDATSLVFVKALEALSRFQPRASDRGSTFRAWLFTIARNVVIDVHRRRRPQTSVDANQMDPEWLIDRSLGPEALAIQADEVRRLHDLLERLPDRQRAVIELRLSGLNGPEIAHALELSISAVKALQVRAYRRLRQDLHSTPSSPEEFSR
jgi:RNA polymerase sigma-70 factor (ECF subfamily)